MIRFVSSSIVILILLTAGCTGRSESQSYLRDDVDLGFYQNIAVMPFLNNSGNDNAPGRIRDITSTQILALDLFDVVSNNLVDSAISADAIKPDTPFDVITLQRLGKILNVQAFLMGTVESYEIARNGSFEYPVVALTLSLIEAEENKIIWQASGFKSGYSNSGRVLGLPSPDELQVAMDLVRTILLTGFNR